MRLGQSLTNHQVASPGAGLARAAACGPAARRARPRVKLVLLPGARRQITYVDGRTKGAGPGDARLVENVTGKGHQTMALGDEPCITATIGLTEQGVV